jgi:hypothetical protein
MLQLKAYLRAKAGIADRLWLRTKSAVTTLTIRMSCFFMAFLSIG